MPMILAFLASTLGRYVIIAIVVGGALFGIRQAGYNAAHRQCVAAEKQREIEIHNRDIRIGELLAKEDERNIADQIKDQEQKNAYQRKLEDELARRPVADRCVLSEPDRKRLR
jgi:hypothetical protein